MSHQPSEPDSVTVTLVVTRRSVLLGGIAVVALGGATLAATDRLDNALRALGVPPKNMPDAGDQELAAMARAQADALIGLVTKQTPASVRNALKAQAAGLPPSQKQATVDGDLRTACQTAARDRSKDAGRAISPDLAVVFASLSAGLDQIVATLERA